MEAQREERERERERGEKEEEGRGERRGAAENALAVAEQARVEFILIMIIRTAPDTMNQWDWICRPLGTATPVSWPLSGSEEDG